MVNMESEKMADGALTMMDDASEDMDADAVVESEDVDDDDEDDSEMVDEREGCREDDDSVVEDVDSERADVSGLEGWCRVPG